MLQIESSSWWLAVVNTANSGQYGVHWIIVAWIKSEEQDVKIQSFDPKRSTSLGFQLQRQLLDRFGQAAVLKAKGLAFQVGRDGWRCGHYVLRCVIALLHVHFPSVEGYRDG